LSLKTEFLAFAFGVVLVLVTFGDNYLGSFLGITVGNLDTILGFRLWPFLDATYFVATILFFLLYGMVKAKKFRINIASMLIFISFLVMLILMSIDDIAKVFSQSFQPPNAYWLVMSFIYPVYGTFAFFLYGKLNKKNDN